MVSIRQTGAVGHKAVKAERESLNLPGPRIQTSHSVECRLRTYGVVTKHCYSILIVGMLWFSEPERRPALRYAPSQAL